MTTKIKLPWRRFGDERPDLSRDCLLFDAAHGAYRRVRATYLELNIATVKLAWRCGPFYNPTNDEDRWTYIDELQSPFEEE